MMSDPGLRAQVVDTGDRAWTNKHLTYTQPLQGLYNVWNPGAGSVLDRYNGTTHALMDVVAEAVKKGVRVRAFGGGWSFSRAPATEGWLLNTKPLNLAFTVDGALVHPAYAGERAGLRFLQCGNSIQELNRLLRSQGRSLRTTGASNGQTIAGAMGTGTHGSRIDGGSVADYVVGMHLITGGGTHVWLERATAPVLSDAFASRLGATPVRDDALFDAALVSFGAFGIVHGVAIETDPLYLLEEHRHRMPFDAPLRKAFQTLDFSGITLPGGAERPYHFQVLLNPYDLAHGAHVTTMYSRPFHPGYTPPPPDSEGFGPGDDAASFSGLLTDVAPVLIPTVVTKLLGLRYGPISGVTGTIGEIFSNTNTRGRAAATSLGVPLERANDALDLLMSINQKSGPFAALFSLRYVRGTGATLGFTRFPRTCIIEVDGSASTRMAGFQQLVWAEFAKSGIPHTFHWGKTFPADAARLRQSYGGAVDQWLAARRTLLAPDARRVFSSAFTDGLGLSV
jgi:FAD/FMN-containing dehydrogenase